MKKINLTLNDISKLVLQVILVLFAIALLWFSFEEDILFGFFVVGGIILIYYIFKTPINYKK